MYVLSDTDWPETVKQVSAAVTPLGLIFSLWLQWRKNNSDDRKFDIQQKQIGAVAGTVQEVKFATDGLTKSLGEAKLAQGTAEGTAVGLQQGRDEAVASASAQPAVPLPVEVVAVAPQVAGLLPAKPAKREGR